MVTRRAPWLFLVVALASIGGCPPMEATNGNSNSNVTGNSNDNGAADESAQPLFDGLTKRSVRAEVSLPEGYTTPRGGLKIVTALGTAKVANGVGEIEVFDDGPQFTAITDVEGTVVALAWLDRERKEINAQTTAEVLVTLKMGVLHLPLEIRKQFLEWIAGNSKVAPLAEAIAADQAADPAALANAEAHWRTVLHEVVAELTDTPTAIKDLNDAKKDARASLRIDPSATRSGVAVLQEPPPGTVETAGLNKIWVQNEYRRRVYAAVRRESFTRDGRSHKSVETIKETELSSIAGITGVASAASAILNAVAFGVYPYSPTTSSAIDTPVYPEDADRTEYSVYILGAGFGAGDELPSNLDEKLFEIQAKTWVLDLMFPTFITVVLPGFADRIDTYYNRTQASDIVQDALNFLATSAPAAYEKLQNNDVSGAWADFATAIANSNATRDAFLVMLQQVIVFVADAGAAGGVVNGFLDVVNVIVQVDRVISLGDAGLQVLHIANSDLVTRFEVSANKSRVSLTPAHRLAQVGDMVELTAAVPDATGDNAPTLAFQWTYGTQFLGSLRDKATGEIIINDQTTNTGEVVYTGTSEGTETIHVAVYNAATQPNTLIGRAEATIEIRNSTVEIVPRRISVRPGRSVEFTAKVPDGLEGRVEDAELLYDWSTRGSFGAFEFGATHQRGESDSVRYFARDDDAEGTESIRVEVFQHVEGAWQSLGAASASAIVERKEHVIVAANAYQTDSDYSWADGWCNTSGGVSFRFPKVEGAISYEIRFYNFYDWALGIREKSFSWPDTSVPSGWTEDGGNYLIGWSGGVGFGPSAEGDCGPPDVSGYASRLSGAIAEVTVRFEDDE